MTEAHPLTRRQKLLAARSVQLGNIVEVLADRFDFTNQAFDIEGSVLEAEAKADAFKEHIELLRKRAEDFRNNIHTHNTPPIVVRRTPPLSPVDNMIWFDTTDLKIFVYLNDNRSKQWVEFD